MPKTENKKQEFINATKREYTVKVTTILKTIGVIALMAGTFIAGWTVRSEFSNEVRSEVKAQMSVQAPKS